MIPEEAEGNVFAAVCLLTGGRGGEWHHVPILHPAPRLLYLHHTHRYLYPSGTTLPCPLFGSRNVTPRSVTPQSLTKFESLKFTPFISQIQQDVERKKWNVFEEATAGNY